MNLSLLEKLKQVPKKKSFKYFENKHIRLNET